MNKIFKSLSLLTFLSAQILANANAAWAGQNTLPPGTVIANENAVQQALNNANARSQAPQQAPPPSTPVGPPP